jgi:hypothetical protein
MSEEHKIKHPLSWWRFYLECLRYATGGAWGRSGDASLIASLALPAWKAFFPLNYATFDGYLLSHHLSADILLWKLPLWVGGSILALRLLAAPFFLYKDKPSSGGALGDHRPQVKLSAVRVATMHVSSRTEFEVENYSDVPAINVSADVVFAGTPYGLRVGPISRVVKGSPQHFVPDMSCEGKPWSYRDARGRLDAFLGAAHKAKAGGAPSSCVAFDVTYADYNGTRFNTRHILTYTPYDPLAPGAQDSIDRITRIDLVYDDQK